MKIVTVDEMRTIEERMINEYAVPSIILMENAANNLCYECEKILRNIRNPKITIVCGPGNNGGDGFALARLLFIKGFLVDIIVSCDKNKIASDALINYTIIKKWNIPVIHVDSQNAKERIHLSIISCDLIVDAIFGSGLTRNVEGVYKELIEKINASQKKVMSVDIPSGINGDTGKVLGCAVNALLTVTFGFIKQGCLLYPAYEYCGELVLTPISINKESLGEYQSLKDYYIDDEIKELLPTRTTRSNKGSYGKTFVFAGNYEMTGAAVLASKASYKIGSGYVHCCFIKSVANIAQSVHLESIYHIISDENGYYCIDSFENIKPLLKDPSVIIVGPGIGVNNSVKEFINALLPYVTVPLVIDADAINLISENLDLLKNIKHLSVITPHPGEMSRLTDISIENILNDPIDCAKKFAKEHHIVVVLKDSRTIVASPDGRVYINTTGNNSLAKAGSGDVLSGIIGGLMAQGLAPYEAASLGTFIHGKAGEFASKDLSLYGVSAEDIVKYIGDVLKDLG